MDSTCICIFEFSAPFKTEWPLQKQGLSPFVADISVALFVLSACFRLVMKTNTFCFYHGIKHLVTSCVVQVLSFYPCRKEEKKSFKSNFYRSLKC